MSDVPVSRRPAPNTIAATSNDSVLAHAAIASLGVWRLGRIAAPDDRRWPFRDRNGTSRDDRTTLA
jgi:hypothetical protein